MPDKDIELPQERRRDPRLPPAKPAGLVDRIQSANPFKRLGDVLDRVTKKPTASRKVSR